MQAWCKISFLTACSNDVSWMWPKDGDSLPGTMHQRKGWFFSKLRLVNRAEMYMLSEGLILVQFSENLFSQTFCSHPRVWPPTPNHSNFWGQALAPAKAAQPTSTFIGKTGKTVCMTGMEKLGGIMGVQSWLGTSQILHLLYMQRKTKVLKIWREWDSLLWLNRAFCAFLWGDIFRSFSVSFCL